jgi:uncharacterized protein (TIGR02246 family)
VSDHDEIRDLITGWTAAVRDHDLDAVTAQHDSDIVMFDVPPPYRGVRGIDEYRESWGPFFEWLRLGAVFEIDELDVVAGTDVAFAYALLRCGTPDDFDATPDIRLRMTIGLRKRDGRWVVTHEHHSFPMA